MAASIVVHEKLPGQKGETKKKKKKKKMNILEFSESFYNNPLS